MSLKSIYVLLVLISTEIYSNAQSGSEILMSYGQNHFINKAPFEVKDSVVCFFLRGNEGAKRVILSGNFINWSPDKLSMNKTDSGWIKCVKLGPGKYRYKFIIDGNWTKDLDNIIAEKDDQGNINSVFFIPNSVFTFNGSVNAKKVYLIASSLNWGSVELPMYKSPTGWQIRLYLTQGIYNYHFIADGKKILDKKNSDQLLDEKDNLSSVLYINLSDYSKQAFRSYQKAIISNNKNETAAALAKIGDFYLSQSDYSNALRHFEKSLVIYQQLKSYDSVGSVYLKIEASSRYQANFTKQLSSIQSAIKAFELSKNAERLAESFRRKGIFYNNTEEWPKAAECFEKAFVIYERLGNERRQVDMLSAIAEDKSWYEKAKSIEITERALKLAEKIG